MYRLPPEHTHLPYAALFRLQCWLSSLYRYQLLFGLLGDASDHRSRWQLHGELDLVQMRLAAQRLVGIHDFKSFQAAGGELLGLWLR